MFIDAEKTTRWYVRFSFICVHSGIADGACVPHGVWKLPEVCGKCPTHVCTHIHHVHTHVCVHIDTFVYTDESVHISTHMPI